MLRSFYDKIKKAAHVLFACNPLAPSKQTKKQRILIIDGLIPYSIFGAGYPRAREIMLALVDMGYEVSIYAMTDVPIDLTKTDETIPPQVKQIKNLRSTGLKLFLTENAHKYSIIFISRPENMTVLQPIMDEGIIDLTKTRIIYDAEALSSMREILKQSILGNPLTETEATSLIQQELSLAKNCDTVICVTEHEKKIFEQRHVRNIYVLGHALQARPTINTFNNRITLLFVGPTSYALAPNAHSMQWFFDHVYPTLQQTIENIPIMLVGNHCPKAIKIPPSPNIQILNAMNDLTDVYNQARVFIAPTRFAAGLPHKIQNAAAHGVPVVCTSLLAAQLGWENEQDLLVADSPEAFAEACIRLYQDPELWEKLRANALKRIEEECSLDAFRSTLKSIIQQN